MWEYEIANKIKNNNNRAREKAVSDASAFIGTVKQRNPLIIQVTEDMIYSADEDEIIESYQFHELWKITSPTQKVKAGDDVIVIPVNSLDTIVVIDKVG